MLVFTSASTVGWKKVPPLLVALAAGQHARALAHRIADVLFDFFHRLHVDERALDDALLHAVANFIAETLSENFLANVS